MRTKNSIKTRLIFVAKMFSLSLTILSTETISAASEATSITVNSGQGQYTNSAPTSSTTLIKLHTKLMKLTPQKPNKAFDIRYVLNPSWKEKIATIPTTIDSMLIDTMRMNERTDIDISTVQDSLFYVHDGEPAVAQTTSLNQDINFAGCVSAKDPNKLLLNFNLNTSFDKNSIHFINNKTFKWFTSQNIILNDKQTFASWYKIPTSAANENTSYLVFLITPEITLTK